jgi:AraC family transcriptional regulator
MTMHSRWLASGRFWIAHDIICRAGPNDRPFEERHDWVCVAAVTQGTFAYRTASGAATLAPGALLLGDTGHCYECSHTHATGDRCLSFHFAPDWFEDVVAAIPRTRRTHFARPSLSPSPQLLPLISAAVAARDDASALEEIAIRLAAAAIACASDSSTPSRAPSERDRRRATDALRRIESASHETFTLAGLAASAGMSPYHFLRTFRQVAGVTPRQFVLMRRLSAAAGLLRLTHRPVADIAFETGFGDLSTFNRRFRRIMGMTPGVYRRAEMCLKRS